MKLDLRRPLSLAGMALTLILFASLLSCREMTSDQSDLRSDSLIAAISENGFYRLSLDDLQGAGLNVESLNLQGIRLSQGDHIVPILIEEDSLLFYGRAPEDRYSQHRPYIIQTGQEGLAMQTVNRPPGDAKQLTAVPRSLALEENNFYDGRPYDGFNADPAMRDPWFWETIQVDGQLEIELVLNDLAPGTAQLKLDLVGVSDNPDVAEDHDLAVAVNGRQLEPIAWDGEASASFLIDVPEGVLQEGANTLVLDNTKAGAAPIDIMRLDRLEVIYPGSPIAVEGQLLTNGAEGHVTLAGFKDLPYIFDISDRDAPLLLEGVVYEKDGRRDNEWQASLWLDQDTHLIAVDSAAIRAPVELLSRAKPALTDSSLQADLLIISPLELMPALEPLLEHRRAQGLSVSAVPLEQIYDEFATAGHGPAAIKAFVTHAYQEWSKPSPAYLLLVGDASYDFQNYLALEQENLLPSPIVPVTYSGETISDARLADVDDDLRPDLAVGRWPVREKRDVESLVRRTIQNELDEVSSRAIFAADGTEARFVSLNEAVIADAGLTLGQQIHLDGPTNEELGEAWAEGAYLVTYAGHGSLDRWGKQGVIDSESVANLQTNGAAPIVLQLTCLTGLFAHPTISSLSEEMLLAGDGPIAIVSATSLSLSDHQRPFGAAFLLAVQDPEVMRIGDAFQYAKMELKVESTDALREISDTFTLFGDPSALIRRPGQ